MALLTREGEAWLFLSARRLRRRFSRFALAPLAKGLCPLFQKIEHTSL
nr:MAG TPA: cysteine-rich protein [Caudoviricetes sp.]